VILVNKGKGNDFWIDENGIMRSRDLRTIFWWSSINKDSTFMDLVSGLPRTPSTYEVVWVIMDERTRFVYFVPYRMNCSINRFAKCILRIFKNFVFGNKKELRIASCLGLSCV